MTSGSLHDRQLSEIDGTRDERLARRVAELYESDPQFRAAAPLPEVIEAACAPDLRLTQIFETVVEGYADRPALGRRARELVTDATGRTSVQLQPRFETISYREVWDRVRFVEAGPAPAGTVISGRPVPVRAESLHGDIFAKRKPRSCSSSFGTMTTSCRVSDGLTIECGQETS